MKAFTVVVFLLLSQVASVEFGADAGEMKRRQLQGGAGKVTTLNLNMPVRRVKAINSKSTKEAKSSKRPSFSDEIPSMSYMSYTATSFDTPATLSKSQKTTSTKDMKGSAKSKTIENQHTCVHDDETFYPFCPGANLGDYCDGAGDCTETTFCNCSIGRDFCNSGINPCDEDEGKRGHSAKYQIKQSKGADKQNGSAKSKDGSNSKGKSGHSEKSQKTIDLTKRMRSSLPSSTEADKQQFEEHVPETASTLSRANAENSAFVYGISSAFLVAVSFVVTDTMIVV